eukprot:1160999-Pelagomonas_calceolata.AAC.5
MATRQSRALALATHLAQQGYPLTLAAHPAQQASSHKHPCCSSNTKRQDKTVTLAAHLAQQIYKLTLAAHPSQQDTARQSQALTLAAHPARSAPAQLPHCPSPACKAACPPPLCSPLPPMLPRVGAAWASRIWAREERVLGKILWPAHMCMCAHYCSNCPFKASAGASALQTSIQAFKHSDPSEAPCLFSSTFDMPGPGTHLRSSPFPLQVLCTAVHGSTDMLSVGLQGQHYQVGSVPPPGVNASAKNERQLACKPRF